MRIQNRCIDNTIMYQLELLEIAFQTVSDENGFRVESRQKRSLNVAQRPRNVRQSLLTDSGETEIENNCSSVAVVAVASYLIAVKSVAPKRCDQNE